MWHRIILFLFGSTLMQFMFKHVFFQAKEARVAILEHFNCVLLGFEKKK